MLKSVLGVSSEQKWIEFKFKKLSNLKREFIRLKLFTHKIVTKYIIIKYIYEYDGCVQNEIK